MVICLERGADLHMAQLMPLPLTVSLSFSLSLSLSLCVCVLAEIRKYSLVTSHVYFEKFEL